MPKVLAQVEEEDQPTTAVKPKKPKKIKKAVVPESPATEQVKLKNKAKREQASQEADIIPTIDKSTKKLDKKKDKKQEEAAVKDVYVSGIPYDATEQQLRDIFEDCGNIELIKLPKYQDSGRCRGYSHIRFSTAAEVKKALKKDGVTMGQRYLKVEAAAGQKPPVSPTEEPPIGCKTLFVKNLPYDITEEGIRTLFQKYGRIDQVRMVYDAFHKHFKGFCFIDYSSPSSLKGGLKMNGAEFQGRRLIARFEAKGPRKGYKPYRKQETE